MWGKSTTTRLTAGRHSVTPKRASELSLLAKTRYECKGAYHNQEGRSYHKLGNVRRSTSGGAIDSAPKGCMLLPEHKQTHPGGYDKGGHEYVLHQ